jgi:hypothetical protein
MGDRGGGEGRGRGERKTARGERGEGRGERVTETAQKRSDRLEGDGGGGESDM